MSSSLYKVITLHCNNINGFTLRSEVHRCHESNPIVACLVHLTFIDFKYLHNYFTNSLINRGNFSAATKRPVKHKAQNWITKSVLVDFESYFSSGFLQKNLSTRSLESRFVVVLSVPTVFKVK